jgi:lipopolysaccharide export system protein LptC
VTAPPDPAPPDSLPPRRAALTPSVARAAPDAAGIRRRRQVVRWSKRLLPAVALLLLGSIALWPEWERLKRVGHNAVREASAIRASNGLMTHARYRGLDGHGQPYTVTASSAHQAGPDRVDLVRPVADIVQTGGHWLLVQADRGVYAPHEALLDLAGHVWLYRDDGTMMWAPVSTLDVRKDVDVSRDWVHVEGPFGVLDAQGSFIAGHEGLGQFAGPARLVLNGSHGGGGVGVAR